jgi:hypothetical protein
MKSFLIIILIGHSCLAQKSEVLKVRKSKNCLGIEQPNLNVLYRNIENLIHLVHTSNYKLVVKIDNGLVIDKNDGNYAIYVNTGTEAIISIYEQRGKTLNIIAVKNFRIMAVPEPLSLYNGKRNGEEISKSQLMNGDGLTLSLNSFPLDVKYEIVSFNISINIGGDIKTEKTTGSALSEGQFALLSKTKNNVRIRIEDIKVKLIGSDGIITLPDLVLKVRG